MGIRKYLSFDFAGVSIFILLFSIVPFLILSVFSNPSLDDFDFSEKVHEMGFLNSQIDWYNTWTGRFFSTAFLSTLNPLIYKSIPGYKILIFMLIVIFVLGIYFLVSVISDGKIKNSTKSIITLSLCFLYIYGMPTSVYGFYWLSSAVIYQGANILMAFLFVLLVKIFSTDNREKSLKTMILVCILILAICGSNELSMAMLATMLFLLFLLSKIITGNFNRKILLFFLISLAGFVIVFLSPGNDHRLGYKEGSGQIMLSFKNSVTGVLEYITYQNINLPIISFTLIFIFLLLKYDTKSIYQNKFFSVNPLWSLLIFVMTIYSGFFTSYWSTGKAPYLRRLNVVYFVFLLGWFVNVFIIVNYFKKKDDPKFKLLPDKYIYLTAFAVVAVSVVIFSNRIKSAYGDLYRGTANKFDLQLRERYNFIEQDQSDTCIVDKINSIPGSIFFVDVGNDLNYRYNKQIAKYFNKKFFMVRDTLHENSLTE